MDDSKILMLKLITRLVILLAYYIMGAYATTDILRLLKGSTLSVNAPDCYCPICGHKIALIHQVPIVAYFFNKKACPYCKSHIPVSEIFLESFLFGGATVICLLFQFGWIAYLINLFLYEGTKITLLIKKGRREEGFRRNLFRSVGNNVVLFGMIAFLFLLRMIVDLYRG